MGRIDEGAGVRGWRKGSLMDRSGLEIGRDRDLSRTRRRGRWGCMVSGLMDDGMTYLLIATAVVCR
jgi:hypothetical protein